MKIGPASLASLAALIAIVFGCLVVSAFVEDQYQDPTDTYKWLSPISPEGQAVVAYCETHLNCIRDFQQLFPRSRLMIWPSFPKRHSTSVTVETLVYGRYLVTISQNIRTDKKALSAVAVGAPELIIWKITDLDYSREGGWSTSYSDEHYLGQTEWIRLLSAKGDLSSIMSPVDKTHPLARAEQYLKELEGS